MTHFLIQSLLSSKFKERERDGIDKEIEMRIERRDNFLSILEMEKRDGER